MALIVRRGLLGGCCGCLTLLVFGGVALALFLWRTNASESLYLACQSEGEADVRYWLAHGADPNFRFDGGDLPLHAAVERGDYPMVRTLLDAGANPRLTNGCERIGEGASEKIRSLLERYGTKNLGGIPEDCLK